MSDTPIITVNIDAACKRCGKKGATETGGVSGSGVCLNCMTAQITKSGNVTPDEWQRRTDVETIIDHLVGTVHRHLAQAHFIAIGRPECTKKHGKEVWASVKLASQAEKILAESEVDYIVTVGLDVWVRLPDAMRLALLDHELSHCAGYDFEAEKWALAGHDIEEFAGVLQRRGAWRADLVAFLEVAQKVELPQTTLNFPAAGEAKP